jgi:hypothetical protein
MSPPFTEASKEGLMRILKHINLLNCILLSVSIFFLYGFLFPRLEKDVSFVVTPLIKKQAEKNIEEALKTQTLSPQEYRVVADQNLFHPDRLIPPEKKPESVLPKPEFVLYGTLITPDLQMAYLEDKKAPVTTPGRGQRQSALKIGESLSGFRVTEIQADKVILTRGEETLQVLLQEPGSSKARETAPAPGPGPGPRMPGMAVTTPAPSPSFPQPGMTVTPAPGTRPIPSGRMRGIPAPGGAVTDSPQPPGPRSIPSGGMPGFPAQGTSPALPQSPGR